MEIREEIMTDAEAVSAVIEAAFATAEHVDGTEAGIVNRLREAGALTISLVAIDHEKIVGHIAFSPVTIDGADRGWFGLGPVAVHPDRQVQGIGGTLVREALDRAKALGARGCVVLGEPDYYGRFGFVADPRLRYAGPPAEYFQALRFGDDRPTGEVAYHPAFG
jgi:putative acetyltransferase